MKTIVNLYSTEQNEIENFLRKFSDTNVIIQDPLKWEKVYENPIEMADIIGVFIDNKEKFKINMWISLDSDVYININDDNAEKIIRYLFERYPY